MSSTTFPTHPPRASGDARLRQPVFRCSAHRLSQTRRAESLRCHSAPCVPGLDAPGASVPPLRLRDFRRVCRACDQSPHPFLLQSLRLHSVTQAPSAGPAHMSEERSHCTFIRPSVPEPERPPSLASTVIPSGSCRACRLACPLSGRQKERCFRIALPDFLRVELWDEPHAPSSVHNRTASHAWSDDNEYIHIKICPSF